MRRRLFQTWLAVALGGGVCLGCQSAASRPYARDPLLASKKPVEGTARVAEPQQVVLAEPAPPALPADAFVMVPPAWRRPARTDLAAGTANPAEVAQAPPTAQPGAGRRPPLKAVLVSRQKTPTPFAHAPDHSWLQGLLGKSESGGRELRYAALASAETDDGKVILEDNPLLEQLRPGDVIRVEGEDLPGGVYRVGAVWLLRRKD